MRVYRGYMYIYIYMYIYKSVYRDYVGVIYDLYRDALVAQEAS